MDVLLLFIKENTILAFVICLGIFVFIYFGYRKRKGERGEGTYSERDGAHNSIFSNVATSSISITSFGPNKIKVLKIIREFSDFDIEDFLDTNSAFGSSLEDLLEDLPGKLLDIMPGSFDEVSSLMELDVPTHDLKMVAERLKDAGASIRIEEF